MCTTLTHSKSKLTDWKLIWREGQFHVTYLICYSDVIVNIKSSLGLIADIMYVREVIQYLRKTVHILAKNSAMILKPYLYRIIFQNVQLFYLLAISHMVPVPMGDVLGDLITTLKFFLSNLFWMMPLCYEFIGWFCSCPPRHFSCKTYCKYQRIKMVSQDLTTGRPKVNWQYFFGP